MQKLLRLFVALVIGLLFGGAVWAVQGSEVDGSAAVTMGAQTISLGRSCTSIIVWTDSSAPAVSLTFNHGATATTANATLAAGGAGLAAGISIPMPPIDQINYYAPASTGRINWMAWTR